MADTVDFSNQQNPSKWAPFESKFVSVIRGAEFVCLVPIELGAVSSLKIVRGRVLATCENGHMIVHKPRKGLA